MTTWKNLKEICRGWNSSALRVPIVAEWHGNKYFYVSLLVEGDEGLYLKLVPANPLVRNALQWQQLLDYLAKWQGDPELCVQLEPPDEWQTKGLLHVDEIKCSLERPGAEACYDYLVIEKFHDEPHVEIGGEG